MLGQITFHSSWQLFQTSTTFLDSPALQTYPEPQKILTALHKWIQLEALHVFGYQGTAESKTHKHFLQELWYLLLEVSTFLLNYLNVLGAFTT